MCWAELARQITFAESTRYYSELFSPLSGNKDGIFIKNNFLIDPFPCPLPSLRRSDTHPGKPSASDPPKSTQFEHMTCTAALFCGRRRRDFRRPYWMTTPTWRADRRTRSNTVIGTYRMVMVKMRGARNCSTHLLNAAVYYYCRTVARRRFSLGATTIKNTKL